MKQPYDRMSTEWAPSLPSPCATTPPLVTFLIRNVHYFMPLGTVSTHSADNNVSSIKLYHFGLVRISLTNVNVLNFQMKQP